MFLIKTTVQFALAIIHEKKVTVEAENWHEALMETIKRNNKGDIIIEDHDLSECNVDIEGWPYQVFDKWTIEDGEYYVNETACWSEQNLTETEMRQALYIMSNDNETKGFSKEKLDKSLAIVANNR